MSNTQWSGWMNDPANSRRYQWRYVNGQVEYRFNDPAELSLNPYQQQQNPWADQSQGLPQGSDISTTNGRVGQSNPGSPQQSHAGTNNPYLSWANQSPGMAQMSGLSTVNGRIDQRGPGSSYAGTNNPYRNNPASSPMQPSYSQYGYGGAQSFDMSSMNASLPGGQSMPTMDQFKTQYKVISLKDQRHFYKPGRVFKTFTFQAKGQNWETSFTVEQLKGQYFAEVRLYIILKSLKTYSVCLPIHTYQGKGTLASHAKASHHVQVYTESKPPPLLPRERLKRTPIKVIVKDKKISLDKASRLNLSKPQSIEHNLPVSGIGKVSKEDLERITKYTLEYLHSGISEAADSPDPDRNDDDEDDGDDDDGDDDEDDGDDDDDDGDEEEEKEEEEKEEEDTVADELPQRRDRNRRRNFSPPKQSQGSSWSSGGLPARPQTSLGIRPSHGRYGRRNW